MHQGLVLLTVLSGALLFSCGGAIDIEEATYAGSCGNPVDVTDAVADSCDDDGCSCGKSCFANGITGIDDPAPGCAKDLEVTYSFEAAARRRSPAVRSRT